jgi:TolB protein
LHWSRRWLPVVGGSPAEAFPGSNGKIAFDTHRDGNEEIYVINADGSGLTNITNNPADDSSARWSPDGTKIAFTSSRSGGINPVNDVFVMNADGSNPINLTNTPVNAEFNPT